MLLQKNIIIRTESVLILLSSGNRFLIFWNAIWTLAIVTFRICSRKLTLLLRSVRDKMMPWPVLPETRKSASASPIYLRSCMYLGLLSMKIRSVSPVNFGLFLPHFLFRLCLIRWYSTLLPWTLLMYRLMLFLDMRGKCFSCFTILPAMASGDWSSYRPSSTCFFNSPCSAILMPWYLASCLLTYALWSAFLGSYLPLTLLRLISSRMFEWLRPSCLATPRMEYPFSNRFPRSNRSLRLILWWPSLFFS